MTRTPRPRAAQPARAALATLALALALVAPVLGAGCATTLESGAIAFRVESNVNDATVWVDDVLIGRASDWAKDGRRIRAGFHRVEIRCPGYYSFFQEVDLTEGGHAVVKAQLRPLIE